MMGPLRFALTDLHTPYVKDNGDDTFLILTSIISFLPDILAAPNSAYMLRGPSGTLICYG